MITKNLTLLPVKAIKGEGRIDSRLIAPELGIRRASLMETIVTHQKSLEEIDQLRFQTRVGKRHQGGGNPEKYALLTENQAVFLMTLSRNTPKVVRLKLRLVQAFARFRDRQQTGADYLPFYHDLHDEVKALARRAQDAGSVTPEQIFHININRMINKVLGFSSEQRSNLTREQRLAASNTNLVAYRALAEAAARGLDHKEAYVLAKEQVTAYTKVMPSLRLPNTNRSTP